MNFTIHAACHSHMGLVRTNHEDNFFFNDLSLQERNIGLSAPLTFTASTAQRQILAVFDGMGGEKFGETAAFEAAKALYAAAHGMDCPGDGDFSREAAQYMNQAVWASAAAHSTSSMGTTLAMLTFREDHVFVCNLGDSRIFRLREGNLHQLSQDHTDEAFLRAQGIHRRPRLTQYLGMDPEETLPEPYVNGFFLQSGDRYLICSDGLTDMLPPGDIAQAMLYADSPAQCTQALVEAALAQGGRDNITAIFCQVEEN